MLDKCPLKGTEYCEYWCPHRYDCPLKKEIQNEAKSKDGVPSD